MRRFGFSSFVLCLVTLTILNSGCVAKEYDKDEMAKLATLTKTCMNIVKGQYYKKPIPEQMSEEEVVSIVKARNAQFDELEQLDGKIDLILYSDTNHVGAVVWDTGNERKLIQELQCTIELDDPAWEREEYGSSFTLKWETCETKQ